MKTRVNDYDQMPVKRLRLSAAFCYAIIHSFLVFFYSKNWNADDLLVGISAAFITGATFDLLAFFFRKYKPIKLAIYFFAITLIAITAIHVIYNESQPDILNAHFALDKHFLFSILLDFNFWLYFAISFALIASFESARLPLLIKRTKRLQIAILITFTCIYIANQDCQACDSLKWQRHSFISHNIMSFLSWNHEPTNYVINGRSLISSVTSKSLIKNENANVLLIMIEGLSAHHLEMGWLPEIEKISQVRGLYLDNFLTHQRQTNRGLFSALCGAYPNLKTRTAKADLIALSGLQQDCLPEALNKLGYHTAFLQSASLGYMSKDLFAQALGFDEWSGKEEINYPPILSGAWGVDDMTLYQEALDKISSYKKPYFISLLTTTTHPPYATPDGNNSKENAFRYASQSVASLIDRLSKAGKLDDTLVIITSDESSASNEHHSLASNRGFFLAINNKIKPRKTSQIFGLVDIPKSILEFVSTKEHSFSGASVFSKFEGERTLFAGHSFNGKIYQIKDFESYITCSVTFECTEMPGNISVSTDKISHIAELVSRNDIPKMRTQNLAKITNKAFKGSNSYTLLGRFITSESPGKTLKLELNLDNINLENKPLQITWINWDCTGASAQTSRQTYSAPANSKAYSLLMVDKQHHSQQCHRVVATSSSPDVKITWLLHSLKLSTTEDSDFKQTIKTKIKTNEIAHAGGRYKTIDYSNSLQALNKNYQQGARLFEIDFNWTSDGQLACIHNWKKSYKDLFPQLSIEKLPSRADFEQHTKNSKITPCTLNSLLTWLDTHPDAYIITDIKSSNMNGLNLISNLSGVRKGNFIPQIHHPINYFLVQELGFSNIIWTLYRSRLSNKDIIKITNQLPNLHAVTMPIARAEQGLAMHLQIPTYVHTINKPADRDRFINELGLTNIYTDTLIGEH